MATFRFLHCADLHIDSPFKGLTANQRPFSNRLQESTFLAFQNLVDLAIREQVDAVVIAGDVYDSNDKSLRAQLKFRDGLSRLAEAGIPSFVVHGNHDPLDSWSHSLEFPPQVKIFSGQEVERVPVVKNNQPAAWMYGISYPSGKVTENLTNKFQRDQGEGFAIGVLHTNVGNQPGHDNYAPCSLDDLISARMDYWALGHIHAHQVLRESDPAVVYPGNTQARHRKEIGPRGVCLVTLHDNIAPEIKFVPVDSVRYFLQDLDISSSSTVDELIRVIQETCMNLSDTAESRDALIHLTLTGRTALHRELHRSDSLKELEESLFNSFEGQSPAVWVQLELKTAGLYDIDALRHGNDFTAELLTLYEEALKGKFNEEIRQVLQPIFETWSGKNYLSPLNDDALRERILEARTISLDRLVEED